MKLISSRHTWLAKWIYPFFALVLLANAVSRLLFDRSQYGEAAATFVLLTPVLALLFLIGPWRLAREVEDKGDALVFRRRGKEQRVALADVLNVEWGQKGRSGVTLWVRTRGALGDRLHFLPVDPWGDTGFKINPNVEALILRIDQARRGLPA